MQHQKWASLSAALTIATAVHAQVVLYVDDDAPAGGDGLSWNSAFNDLQDALDSTRTAAADVSIVLAQGIYLPDRGSGSRDASFELGADDDFQTNSTFSLRILGGFAGLGAPDPDERDPVAFVSVLSGDLQADDTEDFGTRLDNSYHVVTLTQGTGRLISCIGVTIRGGYADGTGERANGGGFYFDTQDSLGISMNQCTVEDCHATGQGGGLYSDMPGLGLYGLTIRSCSARDGGGIAVAPDASFDIGDRCTIVDCHAENGGAVFLSAGGRYNYIRGAKLLSNTATHGGAIQTSAPVEVKGCLIAGNSASLGGAIENRSTDTVVPVSLRNCTLAHNRAEFGGALALHASTTTEAIAVVISDCHASAAGDAVWMQPDSHLRALDSCLVSGLDSVANEGGTLVWGRGMIASDPLFVDPLGPDMNPDTIEDNDYRLQPGSPCIDAAPVAGPNYTYGHGVEQMPFNATCSASVVADMGCYEYAFADCDVPAVRIYVEAAAPSGGDGLSWATALPTIQEAVRVPGVQEIWVAGGTYTPPPPDYGEAIVLASQNPDFRLLGGFAGWETSAEQRDPDANPTLISGDQSGNDDPDLPADLEHNQMSIHSWNGKGWIDGFILQTSGIAVHGDYTVSNCTFESVGPHAALGVGYGQFDVYGCLFKDGSARVTLSGEGSIRDCVFANNTGNEWTGALLFASAEVSVDRCLFLGNDWEFPLVELRYGQAVTNSAFIGNTTPPDTALIDGRRGTVVANCAFAANTGFRPANIGSSSLYGIFTNCWLWSNDFATTPFQYVSVSFSLADFPTTSGPGNILATDPQVVRLPSVGADGQWGTPDDDLGDLRPRAFSPLIDAGDSHALPNDASVFDLAGRPRFVDDPSVGDSGLGFPTVDIGPFERQEASCLADWTGDSLLDINDALAYLADFAAEGTRADLNADGRFNFYDVQIFLNAFAAGCP